MLLNTKMHSCQTFVSGIVLINMTCVHPGGEAGEKDVDIDDDMAPPRFAPVVIDKGRESSSSGSDSSDSGSSDSGMCTQPVSCPLFSSPLVVWSLI